MHVFELADYKIDSYKHKAMMTMLTEIIKCTQICVDIMSVEILNDTDWLNQISCSFLILLPNHNLFGINIHHLPVIRASVSKL